MRASLLAVAVLSAACLVQAVPARAQGGAQGSACAVAGVYTVAGKSPGQGGPYAGKATIVAKNGKCEIQWRTPTSILGSGAYANGVLTVSFDMGGTEGVAVYTRSANGALDGVWWSKAAPSAKGSETLTPDANRAT
jgi:hypothetical protein